jgi:predicted nucleic acid-binding protein
VTGVKVIDASALGAVLFAEPAGERIAGRLRDGRLVAPMLIAYELTNVCLKKIRANPQQRWGFLEAFAAWNQIGIELVEVEHGGVLGVAERSGLTSYDASYLWLAQRLNAELVTLDRRLDRAATQPRSG